MIRRYCRRLWMGLLTLTGIAQQGFFIPYRYANQRTVISKDAFPGISQLYQQAEPDFRNFLKQIGEFSNELIAIGNQPAPHPRWQQDWFPGLDAAAAYSIVCSRRPNKIIEIGCGHSTRFFIRAVADSRLDTIITAIDPAPRANLKDTGINYVKATVQEALPGSMLNDCFSGLEEGDILSIDSSHILMPGTDVDIVLNRVMPKLPAGILIHIHDMFLPDHYPSSWTWRGYNEQLGVAPLIEGGNYEVIWSSHYVRSRMQVEINTIDAIRELPLPSGALESSLWIRKL